jgi:hypothetical protein
MSASRRSSCCSSIFFFLRHISACGFFCCRANSRALPVCRAGRRRRGFGCVGWDGMGWNGMGWEVGVWRKCWRPAAAPPPLRGAAAPPQAVPPHLVRDLPLQQRLLLLELLLALRQVLRGAGRGRGQRVGPGCASGAPAARHPARWSRVRAELLRAELLRATAAAPARRAAPAAPLRAPASCLRTPIALTVAPMAEVAREPPPLGWPDGAPPPPLPSLPPNSFPIISASSGRALWGQGPRSTRQGLSSRSRRPFRARRGGGVERDGNARGFLPGEGVPGSALPPGGWGGALGGAAHAEAAWACWAPPAPPPAQRSLVRGTRFTRASALAGRSLGAGAPARPVHRPRAAVPPRPRAALRGGASPVDLP